MLKFKRRRGRIIGIQYKGRLYRSGQMHVDLAKEPSETVRARVTFDKDGKVQLITEEPFKILKDKINAHEIRLL